jgi:hypothetical protein
VDKKDLQPLDDAVRQTFGETFSKRPNPGGSAALADFFRRTWVERLPAQLQAETNLWNRDRLSWVFPPFDYSPLLDVLESKPRLQILVEESRALWAWLADTYRYQSLDLAGSTFYFEAARDYSRAAGRPLPPVFYLEISGGSAVRLEPDRPSATATIQVRFAGALAKDPAYLQVFTADDDWLQVTPALPAVEPRGTWLLAPDPESGTSEKSVTFSVALKPGAIRSGTPPPRGFLVRVRIGDYAYHHRVPVIVRLAAEGPEILLSTNPEKPTDPVGDLNLRAVEKPQPFYLYVQNPTAKPLTALVDLSVGGSEVAGSVTKILVAAKGTQRVTFPIAAAAAAMTAPPAPTAPGTQPPAAPALPASPPPLPELTGPLLVRVRDAANLNEVLASREIRVAVALPRQYVELTSIAFDPPTAPKDAGNQLVAVLQARRPPLAGPPCPVQLVLPPDRIPGLLGAQGGTFRGVLPADGKPLRLFATGLRFAEGSAEDGYIYLDVDSYQRAFIFRTTFARGGAAATPQEDYRPALRLRAPTTARSDAPFLVGLEVDNAPAGATLQVSLGRVFEGAYQPDQEKTLPRPRRQRIGFAPAADGALLFDASIQDWKIALDTNQIIGPRLLRARLIDAQGNDVRTVSQQVRFVDRAPADVQFVNPPLQAQRGAALSLQASGFDTGSAIQQVTFFVGKPVDGKLPPNAATAQAAPVEGSSSTWAGKLTLPLDRLGPTDISVQFTNSAGLSSFATTALEVLDKLPPTLGSIQGQVVEGPLPQANLEVVLRDERGKPVKDEKGAERLTKTGADGTFRFDNVPPGKYKVFTSKPSSGRKAEKDVQVEAGQVATVMMMLFL